MADSPLATADVAWLACAFDPTRPAALRRWLRVNAAAAGDLLDALVLVLNEAVTTSGETAPSAGPVPVELWRVPARLRCHVACAADLPAVSRAELPADPRVRALWMTMQVHPAIEVAVRRRGTGSRIVVTLPACRV